MIAFLSFLADDGWKMKGKRGKGRWEGGKRAGSMENFEEQTTENYEVGFFGDILFVRASDGL